MKKFNVFIMTAILIILFVLGNTVFSKINIFNDLLFSIVIPLLIFYIVKLCGKHNFKYHNLLSVISILPFIICLIIWILNSGWNGFIYFSGNLPDTSLELSSALEYNFILVKGLILSGVLSIIISNITKKDLPVSITFVFLLLGLFQIITNLNFAIYGVDGVQPDQLDFFIRFFRSFLPLYISIVCVVINLSVRNFLPSVSKEI